MCLRRSPAAVRAASRFIRVVLLGSCRVVSPLTWWRWLVRELVNYEKVCEQVPQKIMKKILNEMDFKTLTDIIRGEIKNATTHKTRRTTGNIKEGWFSTDIKLKITERDRAYVKKYVTFLDNKNEQANTILVHDLELVDSGEVANAMNNQFIDIVKKIIRPQTVDTKQSTNTCGTENKMLMLQKPTNTAEIKKIIDTLKTNAAPGWDGIKSILIKKMKDVLATVLAYIINREMQLGKFPE
ncbi:hypothetical protein HHI36_021742 [Cryptolaemus montrouzieri]|uniref:Uncharacterized protein n=1 Tax=Cryptolaemus montrouzieri TaxID=559131 RepID=A0ABD2MYH4_9CUCU